MHILKHLLAILLGITILPLRKLAYNMWYTMLAGFAGLAAIIVLPLSLASMFKNEGMSPTKNFLLTMLVIVPIIVALISIVLAITATYLIYDTVINMLESFWDGFRGGLLYEMEGFWSAYHSQRVFNEELFLRIDAFINGINEEEPIDDVDFDGFQRVRGELQDVVVVHEDLEVPDLEHKDTKKTSTLLDKTQLEKIDKLIKALTHPNTPLSHQVKEQLASLKKLYMQYNDLSNKLEEVRVALVENDKTKIKDEIIAYNDVDIPILLVKQYQCSKDKKWHNVPANSYITDKESLLHWLKQKPRHPLNKDLLKTPDSYNGMKTRYTWYVLTKEDCSSQELDEAAAQMTVLATELFPLLSSSQQIELGLGSSVQSFFGSGISHQTKSEGELATQYSNMNDGKSPVMQ
ncbi:coiled coil protein [Legionella sp. WA2022007384]